MLNQLQISGIVDTQQQAYLKSKSELQREQLSNIPREQAFVTIITGIRRCGKSTLLLQLLKKKYKKVIFLNFEDIRLTNFEPADFMRLKQVADERGIHVFFFDEIQLAPSWEVFVHQLLREGYTVFATGSNAALLSRELGTRLTGRHLSTELFPFSYTEYVKFLKLRYNESSVKSYLTTGGFPEFIKTGNVLILNQLVDDILVRDIAIRYALRDVHALRQLTVYLITNTGSLVAANKLAGLFGVKSATTILEYISYLQDSYLLELVAQFSYSVKVQLRNPKKVYAIDNGLITALSVSFSENYGHKLENMVYVHLRRQYKNIYYYKNKGECDFVVTQNGRAILLVQVCYALDDFNFKREYNSLLEAMYFFDLKEGLIVTLNTTDSFEEPDGSIIRVIPAFQYLKSAP